MRRAFCILGVAALAILMAGCGSVDNTSPQDTNDKEYGGFTPTDENPAFGDQELSTLFQEEPQYEDPLANDSEIRNAERNRYARHYLVRILWGNLDVPSVTSDTTGGCPETDWSGSIKVDGGVISVIRLLRFERNDLVQARRKAHEFSWISYTSDGVDGILFRVIDTPDPNAQSTNTLRFETNPYETEIPFSQLANYSDFVFIDECNKISIVATEITPSRCSGGFLEGLWMAETDSSGYFKGVWLAHDGSISGHVRGEYKTIDGNRVLYGKWIDNSGRFGGLLKGTWTPLPVDQPGPDGVFEGVWADANYRIAGTFKGHYCFCREPDGGWFHGRWHPNCK